MGFAVVEIWANLGSRGYQVLGAGHAALVIKTHEEILYYITWMPHGSAKLLKEEANMRIGFAKIRDKSGQVVDNPAAYGKPGAVTWEQERRTYGRNPDRTIRLGVRDETTMFGICLYRVEAFWKRVLNLPPDHDMRRFGLISTLA